MEQNWLGNYQKLQQKIKAKRQVGSMVPAGEVKEYNGMLSELALQLKTMAASPMEYEICPSEVARRQALIESLSKQLGTLENIGKSSSTFSVTSSNDNTAMNPMQMNDASLLQRQRDVIAQQDSMVSDIGKGVDRLHRQAVTIGEEARVQTDLLEDIDESVDHATDGLKEETAHAKLVASKAASCYLYICVAVEVIIIFVLLILMFVK